MKKLLLGVVLLAMGACAFAGVSDHALNTSLGAVASDPASAAVAFGMAGSLSLDKITKLANDAAQMTLFASTGATPTLYDSLTPDQQTDLKNTAASELGSPVDLAGLVTWVGNKRADGSMTPEQAAHAAFQAVCFDARADYVA